MPIIKSAKKRVTQTRVKQARNYNVRTALRKAIRKLNDMIKAGDKTGAEKQLSATFKVIDTAAKKNILQKNTASRRKATASKAVAGMSTKKAAATEEKAAPKKKAPAKKKAAAKKAE